MGSTNKTPNYGLTQFIDSDEPSWLGDVNGDMTKIDAQMKANADAISGAVTSAGSADTKATTALETANTAYSEATAAKKAADTATQVGNNAQSTASSASSTAVNALNNANAANTLANKNQAALENDFKWITLTPTVNAEIYNASESEIYINYNAKLKCMNVYYHLVISANNTFPSALSKICTVPQEVWTALGISSDYFLYAGGSCYVGSGAGEITGRVSMKISYSAKELQFLNYTYNGTLNGHVKIDGSQLMVF